MFEWSLMEAFTEVIRQKIPGWYSSNQTTIKVKDVHTITFCSSNNWFWLQTSDHTYMTIKIKFGTIWDYIYLFIIDQPIFNWLVSGKIYNPLRAISFLIHFNCDISNTDSNTKEIKIRNRNWKNLRPRQITVDPLIKMISSRVKP